MITTASRTMAADVSRQSCWSAVRSTIRFPRDHAARSLRETRSARESASRILEIGRRHRGSAIRSGRDPPGRDTARLLNSWCSYGSRLFVLVGRTTTCCLNGAMPGRARASARSFSGWPAWPLTHSQRDGVAGGGGVEAAPEVLVLHRLAVGGTPAVSLPAVDPTAHAVAEIDAVGDDGECRRAVERLQCGDGRHQLHAVVGGGGLAAGELALLARPSPSRATSTAPQPPGPGLPEQAPSV